MKRVEKDLERIGAIRLSEPNGNFEENPNDKPLDLLPEYCIYKDEGCKLAASCLDCPFPRCMDDQPRGRRNGRERSGTKRLYGCVPGRRKKSEK